MGKKHDAILEALENLRTDELKKFKLKRRAARLRKGFRNTPRGALGLLNDMDLTDKLVAFYCEDYGAELTAVVLRDMGMQEEASAASGGRVSPRRRVNAIQLLLAHGQVWTQPLFLAIDLGIQSLPSLLSLSSFGLLPGVPFRTSGQPLLAA